MKCVIAPDSFKEGLTAMEVATAVEAGIRQVFCDCEIIKVPMADGGEGTVKSLVDATGGTVVYKKATGPLGEPVDGFFGLLGGGETAVIEMAAASGLGLVPLDKRNPCVTTTYGFGELIAHALDCGVKTIILGLGGSATNDGGAGMAAALGARLLDENGFEIEPGGLALGKLHGIDMSGFDKRVSGVRFRAACDVDNPLTGSRGASAVFGPQKGATPEMVALLDNALGNYAAVIKRCLGLDVADMPGAGAAGGLGAGVTAFLNANLERGVNIVTEASGLEDKLRGADFVITGEGRMDGQSVYGKTPIGVAKAAKKFGLPVIAICGCVGSDCAAVYEHGIDAVFPCVAGACTLNEALVTAAENVTRTARNVAAMLNLSRR